MAIQKLFLAALASFFFLPALFASEADLADWGKLSRLRAGQRLEVIDMNLKRTRGEFQAATDAELRVSSPSGAVAIPRPQVFRISLLENSKRLRNTLIGVAVGAAAGLAVGAAVDKSFSEEDENIAKMLFVPIGLGVGAGAGAALPAFETIYRAPKRIPPPAPAKP